MSIWKKPIALEAMAAMARGTAVSHLGIEFLAVGDDTLSARLPVDARTRQPMGLLHGGVSVVLAETLGSMAGYFACLPGQVVVGLDINANHLRAVRSGWVMGTARAVHVGRSTQVWAIDITDEAGQPVCVSRLTLAVLNQAPGEDAEPGGLTAQPA
ncbi:MAG: hotdog fold thioesterase [Burkholderiaceae bacterium]|nr:hotdog fold thioesterase [Burkholderiaceae bacterium]